MQSTARASLSRLSFGLSLSVSLLSVVACSGGSGDGVPGSSSSSGGASSSGSSGASGGSSSGSSSSGSSGGSSGSSTPTGKACSGTDECANWFCDCKDGAVVNSSLCLNGSCQGPSAHCEKACNTFNHKGWAGTAGGGDNASKPKDPPAGSCTSKSQCSPFECGCTDGSRISVQECFGGACSTPSSGCQPACSDSGRGDWDGT